MHWISRPEPGFGGRQSAGDSWGDSSFGDYSVSGESFGSQRSAGAGGRNPSRMSSWSSGGVHSYRDTGAKTPQRPLESVRRSGASSAGAPMLQLQKGDMVEHTAFGQGMVLSMRPMGGDALVEVAFDKVGTKKLMLKSAGRHMKKL